MNKTYAILMIGKAIGLAGSFFTTELIARKLSAHEQGLFYSYLSLVGFYYIFDCYSQLLLVRVSHYSSQVSVVGKTIVGNVSVEFAGLVKNSFKVIAYQTLLAFFVIGLVGWVIFYQETTSDLIAWWVTCFACAISALTMPFLAVLEGVGFVCEVAWIRLAQSISIHCASFLALQSGGGVHTLGIGFLAMGILTMLLLFPWFGSFLKLFTVGQMKLTLFSAWKDQWRTYLVGCAVMCMSAVPILFLRQYHGSEIAGAFGMTKRLFDVLIIAGATVFTMRTARFGVLFASDDRRGFARLYCRSVSLGLFISVFSVIGLFFSRDFASMLGFHFPDRLSDDSTVLVLAVASIVSYVVWSLEIAVRSNGEEPLWKLNVARCAFSLIGFSICSKLWGSLGAACALLVIMAFVSFPWSALLAVSFWKKWKPSSP
jgi:O-antigen/teichoic acid export membrane protein